MVDEYKGQGGSYLVDLKTGKRKLVERTQPAPHPTFEVASNGISSDSSTPDPGED
jgi:hypothetical protein